MSDAYDTVEFKPSWLGCSLVSIGLLVLLSVALPLLIRSFQLQRYYGLLLLFVPVFSLLGTLSGVMAVRRSEARSLAGISLVINATVFGSCVAVVLFFLLR